MFALNGAITSYFYFNHENFSYIKNFEALSALYFALLLGKPYPYSTPKKWSAGEKSPTFQIKLRSLCSLTLSWKIQRDALPHIEDVTVALAEKAEDDSTMWDEITKKRQAIKKLYPKP